LGEDKFLRINVAILQMNADDEEKFDLEILVLQRIHEKGNFPLLYNCHSDEDGNYFYLVESLIGPTLKSLYKLCEQIFDSYTIINIEIDLIKNIKILHDCGFFHRELKPDNLAFGNLSYENYYSKNEIGILDFSNSKINLFPNGKIRYLKRKVKYAGNKFYSSSNALKGKDTCKKDDLIRIFYILKYFFRQDLPWKIKHLNGDNLSKKEILEIMENTSLKVLCEHISFDFLNLTEFIFNLPEKEDPDYDYILKELNKMKLNLSNFLFQ
jgi:serine/threonine protein kinase